MFKQFYVKYQMTSSLLLCKTTIELYVNIKLNITRANSLQILSLTQYNISLSNGRYSAYFNYMILFYKNVFIVLYNLDTQPFLFCSFVCYTHYIFDWLDRFKFKNHIAVVNVVFAAQINRMFLLVLRVFLSSMD